jgi:hypothetical protein
MVGAIDDSDRVSREIGFWFFSAGERVSFTYQDRISRRNS